MNAPYERDIRVWAGETGMKALLNSKHPCFQFKATTKDYSVWFDEGFTRYYCVIPRATPVVDPSDEKDFNDNYKVKGNMPVPILLEPFAASSVSFKGDANVAKSCAIDTTTNIDIKPSATQKRLINGGVLYVENAKIQDHIKAQIVDVDDVLGGGANTILNEWIVKWGVIPGHILDLSTNQAGEIPAGVYIRVIYTAAGGGMARLVTVNYRLNKRVSI